MDNLKESKELQRLARFVSNKDRKPIRNIALHLDVKEHEGDFAPLVCEAVVTTENQKISIIVPDHILKSIMHIADGALQPLLQEANEK